MASRPDVMINTDSNSIPLHVFVTNAKEVPIVVKGSNRTSKH